MPIFHSRRYRVKRLQSCIGTSLLFDYAARRISVAISAVPGANRPRIEKAFVSSWARRHSRDSRLFFSTQHMARCNSQPGHELDFTTLRTRSRSRAAATSPSRYLPMAGRLACALQYSLMQMHFISACRRQPHSAQTPIGEESAPEEEPHAAVDGRALIAGQPRLATESPRPLMQNGRR